MNDPSFHLHHLDMNSLGEEDIASALWRLQDLCIRHGTIGEHLKIDFTKVLVSINGIIDLPFVYKDQLFVKNGAKYMMDATEKMHPDIVMLDFSTLADVKFIPLSQCKWKFCSDNDTDPTHTYRNIELTLPNVNLSNTSVMAVIGHTLILHDKLTVTGKNKVQISPYLYPIEKNLVNILQRTQNYISNTTTYTTDENTMEKYITETMFQQDHRGAFIIVLNTPSLYLSYTTLSKEVDERMLRVHGNLGILRKKWNWGLTDYVQSEFNNMTIVHLNPSRDIYIENEDRLGTLVCSDDFNCEHIKDERNHTHLHNHRYSHYEMFRIIA